MYNPEVLCGPCLRAARTPPAGAASSSAGRGAEWVWDSVLFRDALARLDPGAALAIFRAAAGLSQLQLAQMLECSQTTIWRLEAGQRKSLFDIRELLRFADTIGMPRRALLPLILGHHDDRVEFSVQPPPPDPGLEVADDGTVIPAPAGAASARYLLACADRLYLRGQAVGGGSIRGQALRLWNHACRQLDDADHDDTAGRELMRASGELAAVAADACHDCEDRDRARWLYADALVRAGQAGDDRLAVRAMADQALLFTEQARPGLARQAIWLTGQAAELARRDPSPRLHALIAAREAIARAAVSDHSGFKLAIIRAWRDLDREQHHDDPTWLRFVTPAEIAAHEATGRACLGDAAAVGLYRDALRDPGLSPRNAAIYRARLAAVLAADGDIGQAVAEAVVVLDLLAAVSSARTLELLRPVRTAAAQAGLTEFCDRFDALVQQPVLPLRSATR